MPKRQAPLPPSQTPQRQEQQSSSEKARGKFCSRSSSGLIADYKPNSELMDGRQQRYVVKIPVNMDAEVLVPPPPEFCGSDSPLQCEMVIAVSHKKTDSDISEEINFENCYISSDGPQSPALSPSGCSDSGLSSDSNTPPPPLRRRDMVAKSISEDSSLIFEVSDSESNLSTDSLNLNNDSESGVNSELDCNTDNSIHSSQEQIAQSNKKTVTNESPTNTIDKCVPRIDEKSYYERRSAKQTTSDDSDDQGYTFYLNEHRREKDDASSAIENGDKYEFMGFRSIFDKDPESTIRSNKGTVRGVKNRVRAGIATFLDQNIICKVSSTKNIGPTGYSSFFSLSVFEGLEF